MMRAGNLDDLAIQLLLGCTGLSFGLAAGVFLWKLHELKTYEAAENKMKESAEKIAESHNTLVRQMSDLTDRVNGHEFLLNGVKNGVSGNNSSSRFKPR